MKKLLITITLFIVTTAVTAQGIPKFGQNRAYEYLKKQCSFGPRVPGTKAHGLCQAFIVQNLKRCSDSVSLQPFPFTNPKTGKTRILNNIIARFGKSKDRILLCAHWDTRPWADMDEKKENWNKGVPGANDGASGTAILLEIAGILKDNPPAIGIDLVFFDGEDAGSYGDDNSWCQGSKFYAENRGKEPIPRYAVLLDFVGNKNLHLPVEAISQEFAPDIVDLVWSKAQELGLYAFDKSPGPQVLDDHLQLIKAGIPAIDLIDFSYPYYHTTKDTPDKCSPESLGIVGTLLVHLIYE
ncbi:M28 family peptidase [bacterium]|nr:M28 family peptidase [bacterium]